MGRVLEVVVTAGVSICAYEAGRVLVRRVVAGRWSLSGGGQKKKNHQKTRMERWEEAMMLKNGKEEETKTERRELPEEMVTEMLSRHEAFLGEEGQKKVRGACVAVFGVGGVGSHAAMMLARAGVAMLRVVDFDFVSLSSLNRHAVATLEDVGRPKTRAVGETIERIAPFVRVDERPVMFSESTKEKLLEGRLDLVLDCIDDVETKAVLVEACVVRNIPILCCMGAGGKCDPTRLCIAPLADAVHDPLAAKLRWKLRGKGVDYGGAEYTFKNATPPERDPSYQVTCCYSHEPPRCNLLPLTEDQLEQGAQNFGAIDHFRVRVLPVLGPAPAMMGQALASVALCRLAGKQVVPAPREPLSKKIKQKMLEAFRKREARREIGPQARPDDCDWVDCLVSELEFVITEIWRQRCAVTNRKLERKPLAIARWYTSPRGFQASRQAKLPRPLVAADDLVVLAPHLADALDAALDAAPPSADLFQVAASALGGPHVAARIDLRLQTIRAAAGSLSRRPWAASSSS